MMNTKFLLTAAVAALALIAGTTIAAPITVDEFSFEGAKALGGWTGGGAAPGQSTASQPGAWVEVGNGFGSAWTNAANFSGGIPDGDIYAYANGGNYLSQTLTDTYQANTDYTLTVATGWRGDLPGLGFPSYPGYGIELWAGGTVVASDYDTDSGNSGPASDTWKDVTASVTTGNADAFLGEAIEIRLIGYGIQTSYDNVRLDAVPEPGSLALLGLGGLCVLRRRRA